MIDTEYIEPHFVARKANEMIVDKDYAAWLEGVKRNFRSSQVKAAVRVNSSMLEFYWQLGRDIERLHADAKWGTAFFDNLSLDLRREFPEQKGFSVTNLKYIKRWYLFYYERVVNQAITNDAKELFAIRHQLGDELGMPDIFAFVPWKQHIEIITKCQTIDEALFYARHSVEDNWSLAVLKQKIKNSTYTEMGRAVTNFKDKLPEEQAKQAQAILKDPYHFGFLCLKEKYCEQDLEDALMQNVTKFLLEMGQGFSFMGRQMELRMPDGKSYFPDLLFYHTKLHAYVVVELKVVEFMPEFAGKLNFYVTAADNLLRGEGDNPSIGLVICRSANKTIVEWSLKDISKPLGVASYELEQVVNRTIEEMRKKQ